MTTSTIGSVRFKAYVMVLLVDIIVLALSSHVNHFQAFFYTADVFPLALSFATLLFVLAMILLDTYVKNAVSARPPFELGWLSVLGVLWFASNIFSTTRWRFVNPALCRTIPSDGQYGSYHTWCHEIQALRAFIWIEWVAFLLTFAYLLRWTIKQHQNGRSDVWTTAFSHFSESRLSMQSHYRSGADSEFLQWEQFSHSSPMVGYQNESRYMPPKDYPSGISPALYNRYTPTHQYIQPSEETLQPHFPAALPHPPFQSQPIYHSQA